MKRFQSLKIAGLLLVLFAMAACSQQDGSSDDSEGASSSEIKSINPQGASELVANQSAIIIDVREPNEWDQGHIPGAIHIPVAQLTARLAELEQYRDTPVIMQCRSGVRSAQGATKLKAAGFKNLYNLEGGILAWDAAKLPTECDIAQADGSVIAGEC